MKNPESVNARLVEAVADFKRRGARITDADDEFLVELARFRFPDLENGRQEERQISEIQKELGFTNAMQVSRLLQRAKEKGLYRIQIPDLHTQGLVKKLKSQYPHLKQVHIVPWNEEHKELRELLGSKMVEVFDNLCHERGTISVTIGGGRTMRSFVHQLKEKSRSITVSPMALFTRSVIGEVYDSAFLAMVAHWMSGEESRAYVCALPPLPEMRKGNQKVSKEELVNYCHRFYHENNKVQEVFRRSAEPDVAIFGVADLNEKSSIISSVYERIDFGLEKLKKLGGIADMNYTVLTEDGEDLSSTIAESFRFDEVVPKHSHPFLLAVNIQRLRDLSKLKTSDIYVVAGSSHKFKAIRAVIHGKIANCIVTDEKTAQRLISEPLQ